MENKIIDKMDVDNDKKHAIILYRNVQVHICDKCNWQTNVVYTNLMTNLCTNNRNTITNLEDRGDYEEFTYNKQECSACDNKDSMEKYIQLEPQSITSLCSNYMGRIAVYGSRTDVFVDTNTVYEILRSINAEMPESGIDGEKLVVLVDNLQNLLHVKEISLMVAGEDLEKNYNYILELNIHSDD